MKTFAICLLMLIFMVSGCIKPFLGEKKVSDPGKWNVITIKNGKGYIQPTAQVTNRLGFTLMVAINGRGEKIAGLAIPENYHRISSNAAFIEFQVDGYPMQRKTFDIRPNGYGADFYLSEKDIHQIKKGCKLKFRYLKEEGGWSGTVSFNLKDSHKTISYIF